MPRESVLRGGFVWARRALSGPPRRGSAREARAPCAALCDEPWPDPQGVCVCSAGAPDPKLEHWGAPLPYLSGATQPLVAALAAALAEPGMAPEARPPALRPSQPRTAVLAWPENTHRDSVRLRETPCGSWRVPLSWAGWAAAVAAGRRRRPAAVASGGQLTRADSGMPGCACKRDCSSAIYVLRVCMIVRTELAADALLCITCTLVRRLITSLGSEIRSTERNLASLLAVSGAFLEVSDARSQI